MFSPERLALECLISAASAGAQLFNYTEVVELLRTDHTIRGVRARDVAGTVFELHGKLVINAAGPWADLVLGDTESAQKLMRSKGVHIITRSLTTGHALAIASDGGHFFVLPWRGHSMLLTGRLPFDGGSIAEVCSQVLLEPARSPLLLRPDLPPALCDVVLRCLSKDREQRFATAEALAEALLGSLPPQAVTSTFTRRSAP